MPNDKPTSSVWECMFFQSLTNRISLNFWLFVHLMGKSEQFNMVLICIPYKWDRFYLVAMLCLTLLQPLWTVARQAPLSMGFSRQEYWSGCHFLLQCVKVKSESEVAQSCLTPRDHIYCSPPGSSIHGIFQARVLEWVAIAFSASDINSSQTNFSINRDEWAYTRVHIGNTSTKALMSLRRLFISPHISFFVHENSFFFYCWLESFLLVST